MSNKNSELIWVSKRNKEILRDAGNISDSFDSVISRLIESTGLDKKVAMARSTLAGNTESTATVPHQSTSEGDRSDKR